MKKLAKLHKFKGNKFKDDFCKQIPSQGGKNSFLML